VASPPEPWNLRSDRTRAIQARRTAEARRNTRTATGQHLDRYYDEVITQLGQPEALLIFGPGEAKLQLKERLGRSKALSDRIVGIETTDKLTDPQIIAKVKEHYGIDR
jgi:hypothetical protein